MGQAQAAAQEAWRRGRLARFTKAVARKAALVKAVKVRPLSCSIPSLCLLCFHLSMAPSFPFSAPCFPLLARFYPKALSLSVSQTARPLVRRLVLFGLSLTGVCRDGAQAAFAEGQPWHEL